MYAPILSVAHRSFARHVHLSATGASAVDVIVPVALGVVYSCVSTIAAGLPLPVLSPLTCQSTATAIASAGASIIARIAGSVGVKN